MQPRSTGGNSRDSLRLFVFFTRIASVRRATQHTVSAHHKACLRCNHPHLALLQFLLLATLHHLLAMLHFLPSRHRTHPTPASPLTLEQPQAQGLVTVPAQSLCTLLIAVGRRRRYTIGAHVTTTAFTHRLLPICTSHTKLRSRLHTHYGTRVPARRVQIATSRMQRGTGHPLGRVGHQLVECLERLPRRLRHPRSGHAKRRSRHATSRAAQRGGSSRKEPGGVARLRS